MRDVTVTGFTHSSHISKTLPITETTSLLPWKRFLPKTNNILVLSCRGLGETQQDRFLYAALSLENGPGGWSPGKCIPLLGRQCETPTLSGTVRNF